MSLRGRFRVGAKLQPRSSNGLGERAEELLSVPVFSIATSGGNSPAGRRLLLIQRWLRNNFRHCLLRGMHSLHAPSIQETRVSVQ